MADDRFVERLKGIFEGLHDAHTRICFPGLGVCRLPFRIGRFATIQEQEGEPTWRFVVTDLDCAPQALREPTRATRCRAGEVSLLEGLDGVFERGVEVTHWNGVPIAEAVESLGRCSDGANEASRSERGMRLLTRRFLSFQSAPREDWVQVTFRRSQEPEVEYEGRFSWRWSNEGDGLQREGAEIGSARTSRRSLSEVPAVPLTFFREGSLARCGRFVAGRLESGSQRLGYLGVRDFTLLGNEDREIERELRELESVLRRATPDVTGLVIDLRGNRGGSIRLADAVLRALTPRHLAGARFQLRTAREIDDLLELCAFEDWASPLGEAAMLGERVTAPRPAFGRTKPQPLFTGSLALLVDAQTYSAAELFAAGFVDHGLGRVFSTSGATGGGGSEAWNNEGLLSLRYSPRSLESVHSGDLVDRIHGSLDPARRAQLLALVVDVLQERCACIGRLVEHTASEVVHVRRNRRAGSRVIATLTIPGRSGSRVLVDVLDDRGSRRLEVVVQPFPADERLPAGVEVEFAVRRAVRANDAPLEEVGVPVPSADVVWPSRLDALGRDCRVLRAAVASFH